MTAPTSPGPSSPSTEHTPPERRGPSSGGGRGEFLRTVGVYGAMGMEITAAIIIPLLLGLWLDRRWDILPVLTLVGLLLGFLTAGRIVYRYLRLLTRDNELAAQDKSSRDGDSPD